MPSFTLRSQTTVTKGVIVAGLIAIAVGIAWHADRFDFIGDDAYISFRYAENLALHGELNWNAGETPVEGYTNFLWTVILAVGIWIGVAPEVTAKLLGAGFAILCAGALYLMGRVIRGPDSEPQGWDLLAPALLATWGSFCCWASGGMETALFAFLLTLALTLYVREAVLDHRMRWSALCFALAAMTRPEGALAFAVVGAHRLLWTTGNLIHHAVRRRPALRREIDISLQRDGIWVLLFVALYGTYFLWRYTYYGYLYPNTYYIKVATSNAAETRALGWTYLKTFVRDYQLLWYSPALLLGLGVAVRGGRGAWRRVFFLWSLLLPLLVIFAWHIVRFGGDFMAMHRFFVPLIPILALIIAFAARAISELTIELALPARARLFTFIPLSALLLGLFISRSTDLDRRTLRTIQVRPTGYTGDYDNMETVAYMKKFARDRILIGRWLRRRAPKNTLFVVGGAGALVYSSGLRGVDSFGLSDLWVAHENPAVSPRPGHQKRATLAYVLRLQPDILCHPQVVRMQNWEYRPRRGERRMWERRGYRYFCATPRGLYPSHYCCLMSTARPLGLTPVSAYRPD